MTRQEALNLLLEYQEFSVEPSSVKPKLKLEILNTIAERFPLDGSEAKVMRWLGFAQGVLLATDWFTLGELKQHSKNKTMRLTGSVDRALQDPKFAAAVDAQVEAHQAQVMHDQAREIVILRKKLADLGVPKEERTPPYDILTRGGTLKCVICCDTGMVFQQKDGEPMERVPCIKPECVKLLAALQRTAVVGNR